MSKPNESLLELFLTFEFFKSVYFFINEHLLIATESSAKPGGPQQPPKKADQSHDAMGTKWPKSMWDNTESKIIGFQEESIFVCSKSWIVKVIEMITQTETKAKIQSNGWQQGFTEEKKYQQRE